MSEYISWAFIIFVGLITVSWLLKAKDKSDSKQQNHRRVSPVSGAPRDFSGATPHPQKQLRGPCYVIDGDTIVIRNVRIRLWGIDAPELDHPYGRNAKWALVRLTRGSHVTAVFKDDVSYDRIVAQCFLPDGTDISEHLVRQGLALDWYKFSGGHYRSLEPAGVRRKLWRSDARMKGQFPP